MLLSPGEQFAKRREADGVILKDDVSRYVIVLASVQERFPKLKVALEAP